MLETIQNIVNNVSSTTHSWLHSTWEAKTPTSSPKSWKNLRRYTLSEVAEHCHHNDCWLIVYDLVYDVTNFLNEHPGGEYIVMENAGRDSTLQFRGSRHSKDAFDMLDQYCIGILVEVLINITVNWVSNLIIFYYFSFRTRGYTPLLTMNCLRVTPDHKMCRNWFLSNQSLICIEIFIEFIFIINFCISYRKYFSIIYCIIK